MPARRPTALTNSPRSSTPPGPKNTFHSSEGIYATAIAEIAGECLVNERCDILHDMTTGNVHAKTTVEIAADAGSKMLQGKYNARNVSATAATEITADDSGEAKQVEYTARNTTGRPCPLTERNDSSYVLSSGLCAALQLGHTYSYNYLAFRDRHP